MSEHQKPSEAVRKPNPLARLADTHAHIQRHAACIEVWTQGGNVEDEAFHAAVDFLGRDVLRHHLVEELELFPRVLAVVPEESRAEMHNLITALRRDHRELEVLWYHVLPALGSAARRPSLEERQDLATFLASYRQHLKREDTGILPVAGRLLDPNALAAIDNVMRSAGALTGSAAP